MPLPGGEDLGGNLGEPWPAPQAEKPETRQTMWTDAHEHGRLQPAPPAATSPTTHTSDNRGFGVSCFPGTSLGLRCGDSELAAGTF